MGRKKKKRKQRAGRRPDVATAPAEPAAIDPDPPAPPPPETGAPEIDADLDVDEGPDSYESLVAAVAEMEDEAPERPLPSGSDTEAAEDVEEVHDLDDEDSAAGGLDTLIAQVGRTTTVGEQRIEPEAEVPVIDLDDDAPAAPSRRAPAVTASEQPPELSRLARAAAAGGVDDTEPRAIPLDLYGDISTPEARARLLAEALAHAEHKEARYRVPLADRRRLARWKSAGAAAVLALAAVVAVAPPAWVLPEPPAVLSEADRVRGIRLALLLQAQQIEAHRVLTQELPRSLEELPARLAGIRYTQSGRSYQLVSFMPDGSPVVYDAADPSPAFRALADALTAAGQSP